MTNRCSSIAGVPGVDVHARDLEPLFYELHLGDGMDQTPQEVEGSSKALIPSLQVP